MLYLGCLLILLAPLGAMAQDTPAEQKPAEPKYEFCSGTVVDLSPDSITVRRTLAGPEYEERRFVINSETKVEGTLKTDRRVTVGFVKTEEGEIARRILVRGRT